MCVYMCVYVYIHTYIYPLQSQSGEPFLCSWHPLTTCDQKCNQLWQVVDSGQRTVRYFNTVCLASPEGKIVPWLASASW